MKTPVKIGVLHPGAMGASVGAALRQSAHDVLWVSGGRSSETAARAASAGFRAKDQLQDLLEAVDAVISVCPPAHAVELARQVHRLGFTGLYVDANAISPRTAAEVHALFGSKYVDGGIVGPPAWRDGTTRLYLSGERAADVAAWFSGGFVEAAVVAADSPLAASALKMCYAAYTKGHAALLLAVDAAARAQGVHDTLRQEWARSQPSLARGVTAAARGSAPKGWRFEGEMLEIARTFEDAGLPPEFHYAAAEIYRRLAGFKNAEAESVDADAVAGALTSGVPSRDGR